MKKNLLLYICLLSMVSLFVSCNSNDLQSDATKTYICADPPIIIYSEEGRYVAFCDAIKYAGRYYCVFREGENHAPYHDYHQNGYLKILSSSDLKSWNEELEIKDVEWDLRDPCFCTVGNRLYLYYGLYSYKTPNPSQKTGLTKLFVNNGSLHIENSEKVDIGSYSNLWLWKVYYENGEFYGTAYGEGFPLLYVKSNDGVHFSNISEITNKGNETSIVEMGDKKKVAVIRNIISQKNSLLSISQPPYINWEVYELNEMIESPESFVYNNDIYTIGRSSYGMSLFKLDIREKTVEPIYNFFAFGDWGNSGYPGIIMEGNSITVIYYAINPSTNETAIYQTNLLFTRI